MYVAGIEVEHELVTMKVSTKIIGPYRINCSYILIMCTVFWIFECRVTLSHYSCTNIKITSIDNLDCVMMLASFYCNCI